MVKIYNDEKQQFQVKKPGDFSVKNILNYSKSLSSTTLIPEEVFYAN